MGTLPHHHWRRRWKVEQFRGIYWEYLLLAHQPDRRAAVMRWQRIWNTLAIFWRFLENICTLIYALEPPPVSFSRRCSIWQIDFLLTFFCSIDYRIKIAFYHRYKHYIYLYFIHFERDNHLREVGFLNYLDNVWGTIKCVSVATSLKAADDGLSVSQHP